MRCCRSGGAASTLHPNVYAHIIQQRLYGAKPDLNWLREQAYPMLKPRRISHVWGCEHEARRLAERWGCDRMLLQRPEFCTIARKN